MRRAIAWLAAVGVGTLLLAIPLWHVERIDMSGCTAGVPCDPRVYLPYGNVAAALTVLGTLAIVATALLLFLRVLAAARNPDVRSVRGARADPEERSSS
ncbi:MAG: hypothetical protein ACXVQJ_04890 [Actinomycetota bacterium]